MKINKTIIWCLIVLGAYAYGQKSGYYIGALFGGSQWQRAGSTFNHK